jgi:hypothetical protein
VGENICKPSDKWLISKMFKELEQPNSKETNNLIKKWARDLNTYFSNNAIEIANMFVK